MYPSNTPPERLTAILAVPRQLVDAAIVAGLARQPDNLSIIATVTDLASLEQAVRTTRHSVIFLHHNFPDSWEGLAHYLQTLGNTPVILLVDRRLMLEPDLLAPEKSGFPPAVQAEAERAGCVGIAPWPPGPGQFGPLARAVVVERRVATPTREHRGIVLGFYSDSHSGASEMAINVATLLGLRGTRERRVLLADLDPTAADIHLMLRLSPTNSAGLDYLWSNHSTELKSGSAGSLLTGDSPLVPYMMRYPSAGEMRNTEGREIDVLTGLQNRQLVGQFGTAAVAAGPLVRVMRTEYELSVLDLGRDLGPMQQALAAECDHLFVVTSPMRADVEANALGFTRLMKLTGISRSRMHLLINRWGDPSTQHTIEDIVRRFEGIDIAGAVDLDETLVRRARWDGFPPPILDTGSAGRIRPFVAQIEAIVNHIMPGSVAPRQPTGFARFASRRRLFSGDAPSQPGPSYDNANASFFAPKPGQ